MVVSLAGLGPKKDCAGVAQQQQYTIDQSSRQTGRPVSTTQQLSDGNKNLVIDSRWVPDTGTDWQTDHLS
jgi:hypothetical protein